MRAFISTAVTVFAALAEAAAQPQPGNVLWTYDTGSSTTIKSSPAVAPDGTIYFGAGGSLYAMTNMGSNRWTLALGNGQYSSPAVAADGTIYVATSASGYLYAVSPDGTQKWNYATGGYGSPGIGLDGSIYCAGYTFLYAVSPDGTNEWQHRIGGGGKVRLARDQP